MQMRWSLAWVDCAAVVLAAASPASAQQSLTSGESTTIRLSTDDPPLEGHGPARRLAFVVPTDGAIYVHAASEQLDPWLRIEDAAGSRLAEDDNSGGGTTAYLKRAVAAGEMLSIVVAGASPTGIGEVTVRLTAIRRLPAEHAAALQEAKNSVRSANASVKQVDYEQGRTYAEAAVTKLLAIRSPVEHEEVASLLLNAAASAYNAQDARGAEQAWSAVLGFMARTLPDSHVELQRIRGNVAVTMRARGDAAGALVLESKVLDVFTRTLPDDHLDLQIARENVASSRRALGDVEGTYELFEKVYEVRSRKLRDDDEALQRARLNLASARFQRGDLQGALELETKAHEVWSRTLHDDDPRLQSARLNLALTLKGLGDLGRALALEEAAYAACSRTLRDDDALLQKARNNLAATRRELGDARGSLELTEKVLEVLARSRPGDDPELLGARLNLANALRDLGDPEHALEIEQEVLAIRARRLSDDHPDLQTVRQDLAVTKGELGDFRGALELEEKILAVRSRTLPDSHPDRIAALLNLAGTKEKLNDLAGALALVEKAHASCSRALPEGDAERQRALRHLALLVARTADRSRLRELLAALAVGTRRGVERWLGSLSPREIERVAVSSMDDTDALLSLDGAADASLEPLVFAAIESLRAVRATGLRVAGAAVSSADPGVLRDLRSAVVRASREVTRTATTDPSRFSAAIAGRDDAQRKLQRFLGSLPAVEAVLPKVDLAAITAALKADEAAVAYWRFQRAAVDRATRELKYVGESYVAYVLRASQPLARIDLGPADAIDAAVERWRAEVKCPLSDEDSAPDRSVGGAEKARPATDSAALGRRAAGEELRRLVFDPLRPLLGDARRVIVVPDDALFLVPLDALPEGKSCVGDRIELVARVALKELTIPTQPPSGAPSLLALGGVTFARASETPSGSDAPAPRSSLASLPATDEEVASVAARFREHFSADAAVELLTGPKASREAFEALAPTARFLHLATHAGFDPDSVPSDRNARTDARRPSLKTLFRHDEDVCELAPLVLCGLAFAEAGASRDERPGNAAMMTAEELCALDLGNCELAVLSACETNVGRRRAGQGIASLQQALHAAGVRTAITSLWKVPDEATRELMTDFYRRLWVEKRPKARALWEAKRHLREQKNPDGSPRFAARDWAAWVMSGEPD